ncbi:LysR family transcriptional regulator [Halopseudomonas pachastrellae]|nr:LysR family transcriptional regulator [Halopseudomonas pachastrellae]
MRRKRCAKANHFIDYDENPTTRRLGAISHYGRRRQLSAAARQLDVAPAVASAAIKRLEAQLGVRTVRAHHPPPAPERGGRALSTRCPPSLAAPARRRTGAGRRRPRADRHPAPDPAIQPGAQPSARLVGRLSGRAPGGAAGDAGE